MYDPDISKVDLVHFYRVNLFIFVGSSEKKKVSQFQLCMFTGAQKQMIIRNNSSSVFHIDAELMINNYELQKKVVQSLQKLDFFIRK